MKNTKIKSLDNKQKEEIQKLIDKSIEGILKETGLVIVVGLIIALIITLVFLK